MFIMTLSSQIFFLNSHDIFLKKPYFLSFKVPIAHFHYFFPIFYRSHSFYSSYSSYFSTFPSNDIMDPNVYNNIKEPNFFPVTFSTFSWFFSTFTKVPTLISLLSFSNLFYILMIFLYFHHSLYNSYISYSPYRHFSTFIKALKEAFSHFP